MNILNTRIQLKLDTYEHWMQSKLILLPGELAFCVIPPNTLNNNPKSLLMCKAGNDQQLTFKDLEWISGSAFVDINNNNIIDTYATKKDLSLIEELYQIVSTIEERNNIPLSERVIGMRVYVKTNDVLYTWNGVNWSQSLSTNDLLDYFDPKYFNTTEGQHLLSLSVDEKVTQGSVKLITSGAVFQHVEDTVGVIEDVLKTI